MPNLNPEQVAAARRRGADTDIVKKEVTVEGLHELVDQLKAMIDSQKKSSAVVLTAIQQLVVVIGNKEFKGTNVTELVSAVKSLKSDYDHPQVMYDWDLEIERDSQRHLMKKVRFVAVPRVLN